MAPKKNDNTITINKEVKNKDSKTKESKTKESKTKEPEESEEESEEDSEEEESEEDSEEESEEESENVKKSENEESENEESENVKKSVKEKKIKKTWQENIDELTQLTTDLKKNENEHKLFQENLHKNEKTRSELIKQLSRVNALLSKSVEEGIKNGSKKPKRKTNSGGFKEGPIPPKLIKYLNLDNEIQMARPKVGSLLYNKFKSDNLTNGQNITFDKDTAKFFGKNKDYELNFKQFQTFLKEIYDEAFPKS